MGKYGPVESLELFNFSKENIAKIIAYANPKPIKDEMKGFEEMMHRVSRNERLDNSGDPFENVLRTHRHELLRRFKYKATRSNVDIAKAYIELTESDKQEIALSVFRKGRQMKNLHKGVFINGLLHFSDYESKLKLLLSPVYKFGMKFYDQQKNIHFSDADFANTLSIQSEEFSNKRLVDACDIINTVLVNSGFTNDDLCIVGKLKALNDINLENVLVRPQTSISVRFHNFSEAKEAFYYLSQSRSVGRNKFRVKFANPTTTYYDAKFATVFENVIKNKFERLDKIIEVPSNYAQIRLDEINSQS